MTELTGHIMSRDKEIATVENGIITSSDEALLPLYLKRTGDLEEWLRSRAIDSHRTNSRLLKKVLRLSAYDDMQTVLSVHAATITDTYWVRLLGEELTWEQVRFKENMFDRLALYGDPDSFDHPSSPTPELTNTGSFEKCWRLIDGRWWMYKSGDELERFSELFIYHLGRELGFDMALYEADGKYVRSLDFTHGATVNFEPMEGLVGGDEGYQRSFDVLMDIFEELAAQYLRLIYLDSLCFNMDRHTRNYGVLRDVQSGRIIALAPNYDNNIALIARGYRSSVDREKDALINFFEEFIGNDKRARALLCGMDVPQADARMIDACLEKVPITVDSEYIHAFLQNGQERLLDIISGGQDPGFTQQI